MNADRLLRLSRLLTERPAREHAEALGVDLEGGEGEEYDRLFRIPAGRFVPPFLAAHQKRVSPQKYIDVLKQLYRAAGYEIGEGVGERPDHVGVLLEFIALCSDGCNGTLQKIQEFTAPALRAYASRLREEAHSRLYRDLADRLHRIADEGIQTERDG